MMVIKMNFYGDWFNKYFFTCFQPGVQTFPASDTRGNWNVEQACRGISTKSVLGCDYCFWGSVSRRGKPVTRCPVNTLRHWYHHRRAGKFFSTEKWLHHFLIVICVIDICSPNYGISVHTVCLFVDKSSDSSYICYFTVRTVSLFLLTDDNLGSELSVSCQIWPGCHSKDQNKIFQML